MSNPILSFVGGTVTGAASTSTNPIMLIAQYESNAVLPIVIPDEGSLFQAYFTGHMEDATFSTNLAKLGKKVDNPVAALKYTMIRDGKAIVDESLQAIALNVNEQALQGARYTPSIDEANLLRNRELIDDNLHAHIVNHQTGKNGALGNVFRQLRHEIPGPSDLVRFAVRDCFTPAVVSQFEYAKETPTAIKPWMAKQGFAQSIGLALPANATNAADEAITGDASWFDLFWWSHWELPSPTQGYEMLYRLYLESDYGPSPFVTSTNAFAAQDLELLLKASDYPQYWRERLIAISYHNLNRSDIIPMYERGLVERADVYHALRADGYRDAEAKQLVRLADFKKQQYLGVDVQKKSKEWICKTYSEGYITRESAEHRLEQLGLTYPGIYGFLDQCDLENAYKLNQLTISTVQRGFIRGILTEDDARNALNTFILVPSAIDRKINTWTLQRNGRYKQLSAMKNVKAYNLGLINRNETIARLQNLQYEPTAITTMLGLADYDIAQRQLKRVQQQLIASQKAAKQALLDQQKATKEELKKAKVVKSNIDKVNKARVRQLIIAMTDKNIIQFWKKKTVFLWEIFYRLYYRDFSIIDARKWVKSYIDGPTTLELENAEAQAQKVYRSEPNPPLV